MTNVAQVGQAKAADLNDEDRVQAPTAAPNIVVVSRQCENSYVLRTEVNGVPVRTSGHQAAQHNGGTREQTRVVMVSVLVAYRDDIHLHVGQGVADIPKGVEGARRAGISLTAYLHPHRLNNRSRM